MSYDVVIVGAGIVGAACAFEFSSRGMKVAVIEEGAIGGGATAAAMGHILVMSESEPQFRLTRYSQKLWQELRQELPADCEYEQPGTLWIAANQEEMAEVRARHLFYAKAGVPSWIFEEKELAEAEPQLRRGLEGALFMPEDAVTSPDCVARYLLGRAQSSGAVVLHETVWRLADEGVLLKNGTTISGGVLINAAGSRAAKLTPTLPVTPRKGQLVLTEPCPGLVNHQIVELAYLKSAHGNEVDSVAFNIQPRRTGQVLVGSSRQYGTEDASLDHSMLDRMLAHAIDYMPPLKSVAHARAWTGFRAATPDKLPLIGRCIGSKSVYAATGHEGLGITTSLGTAKLLADEMFQRDSPISRLPYQPERYENPAQVDQKA